MGRGAKMPTVMPSQHKFSMVPQATIERSVFDRSHGRKMTFNAGTLVPFLLDLVVPGDTVSCRAHLLARLATPIKPVMDNMFVETFFFFVPLRLVWSNFVKFMGEQEPSTFTVYTVPITTVPGAGYPVGSVMDYLGVPASIACSGASWTHSALPLRCYTLVYNQWFRDENLVASLNVGFGGGVMSIGDGPDTPTTGAPLKRGKRHDYFTSCLPWTQKSASAITVAFGATYAPVYVPTGAVAIGAGVTQGAAATPKLLNSVGANNIQVTASAGGTPLLADLTGAVYTINSLRQAFQVQKFLERDARGGTRYTEKVRAHFGVTSPDARLQRAEYLGGGSTPMNVTPIPQNTPLTAAPTIAGSGAAVGYLGGMGVAAGGGHGFTKSFTEHGYILGLVNVRADLTYAQGLERHWSYSTIYDFPWPTFAHLGEQTVLNQEIFLADNAGQNVATFGYQERYAELRYKPSGIAGLFRSYVASTLSLWTLQENFAALPTLGQTFIEDQTSTILDRVVAVTTEPDILFDSYIEYKWARPFPVYGVPGMIDHF